jgi:hypothetical protein
MLSVLNDRNSNQKGYRCEENKKAIRTVQIARNGIINPA